MQWRLIPHRVPCSARVNVAEGWLSCCQSGKISSVNEYKIFPITCNQKQRLTHPWEKIKKMLVLLAIPRSPTWGDYTQFVPVLLEWVWNIFKWCEPFPPSHDCFKVSKYLSIFFWKKYKPFSKMYKPFTKDCASFKIKIEIFKLSQFFSFEYFVSLKYIWVRIFLNILTIFLTFNNLNIKY